MNKINYIDPIKLHKLLTGYVNNKELDSECKMSNELAKVILDIAENFGNSFNFRSYTYLDEMKALGIEYCLRYAHKYKPELHTDDRPVCFSFLTAHMKNGFLQVLEKRKREEVNFNLYKDDVMNNNFIAIDKNLQKTYRYNRIEYIEDEIDKKELSEREVENVIMYGDSESVDVTVL